MRLIGVRMLLDAGGLSGRYRKHPWGRALTGEQSWNSVCLKHFPSNCGHLKIFPIQRHSVDYCVEVDGASARGFIWQVQEASLGAGTDRRAELMELKQAGTIPSLPPPLLSVHTTQCNNILNATTKHQHYNITITTQQHLPLSVHTTVFYELGVNNKIRITHSSTWKAKM